MRIEEWPEFSQKGDVLRFQTGVSVADAVRAMAQRDYGSSVIIDENNDLKGIFTERDLLKRVVNKGLDPTTTKLEDVMTHEVKVAKAGDDMVHWLRIMSNERFRHLPVVDGDGRVVSMMSQGDFVSYTWPELLTRVGEQTRASLGGRFYPVLIASAIVIYTIAVLFVFGN